MGIRIRLFAFVFALTIPALAQVRGSLHGTVVDPTGAVVPNAKVVLTQDTTNIQRKTNTTGTGDFTFADLDVGSYHLTVDSPGFKTATAPNINISVGQTASVKITITVKSEGVIDIDDSWAYPPLQTQTSDIQTTIESEQIEGMPLNSRNFVQLATLAPGVALPPGTLLPRINGGRPRTNEYIYDGISALQPEPGQVVFFPILDDIQEFTIQSNNVSAEFGRFNGGVINVAMKAGTNRLHGSLFDYLRNDALNARNYFSTSSRKPEYRRNLYGATLGGPIHRDRVFFFAGYQGVQQAIGVTRISTVPTLAERQGIFTGVAHIYDPATTTISGGKYVRQEFPDDVISTPLDPAAQELLSRIPLPTAPGAANNYSRTGIDSDRQNQFDVRMDGVIGIGTRLFSRYSYFRDNETPVTPFPEGSGITGSVLGTGGVSGISRIQGQQAVFAVDNTLTANTMNEFRLGYTRRSNVVAGPSLSDTASNALNIPGIPTNAAFNNTLPLITFTGFQQLGPSASTNANFQTGVWQAFDEVQHVAGSHSLKAGIDFRWYQLNTVAPPDPTGAFAFTVTGTNQQGVTNSGNAFASFLLGQVDTFQIDLQRSKLRPRDHIEEFFFQDDWHAARKLTVNLGARYTLHFPSTELSDQGAVFNLSTQKLDYLGQNGYSRSARELHFGNIAPRIGLAYSPTDKWVVRSGYGIVFIDQSGITTPFTTPQFPFIQNVQQRTQDNVNAAFALSSGPTVTAIALTPDAGLGQSVYTANRRAGSGYVQQWNVATQREITPTLSVEIAYVGSHIVHVGIPDSNLNQLTTAQLAQGASLLQKVPNPYYGQIPASSSLGGATVTAAQLLKPYPEFLNVATYRDNRGGSIYHALEIKAQKRFSQHLNAMVSYTHSRLLDDASAVFSTTVLSSPNSNSLVAADTYRPSLERDVSSGDTPNVTSAAVIYELPAGAGRRFASHGWTEKVFGRWTINGILLLQSGMPVTVTQATNLNAFAGFALQRPKLVGDPSLPSDQRTPKQFFNTAAFATTPQFQIGNASRNPVRGPAYRNLDLALVKTARIHDRANVEFRAELFNVTNTPAFAQPNGSFGSPAFGTITSTVTDPRVAQFALRISY